MNHLVITVGQSDLQVGCQIEGKKARYKLDRESIRSFHESLVTGSVSYQLVPFEESHQWVESDEGVAYDRHALKLEGRKSKSGNRFELEAKAGVILVAPLVSNLLTRSIINEIKFDSVLFLTTNRENRAGEPVGVFHVLRNALAERFFLSQERIIERQFLQANESLYFEDDIGQRILHPRAAHRIDSAIYEMVGKEKPNNATLYISDSGGLPEAKPVLAASARYRAAKVFFVPAVQYVAVRDNNLPSIVIGPADSLHIRRHVRRLVENGSFTEASFLIDPDPSEGIRAQLQEPWREWLLKVPQALNGMGLKFTDKRGRTRPVLGDLVKAGSAMWVAFRVESALRAKDFREALRWQFTLQDIVLRKFQKKLMGKEPDEALENWKIHLQWPDDPKKSAFTAFHEKMSITRLARNSATHGWVDENRLKEVCDICRASGLWRTSPPCFLGDPCVETLLLNAANCDKKAATLYQNLIDALLSDMDEFSLLNPPAA